MEEKDAILLLEKLEKFMRDTTAQINSLINKTHNLQVDIDNLKKNLNQNKILVKH